MCFTGEGDELFYICKSVESRMSNEGVWSQLLSQMVPYGYNQAEHRGF